jgi:hypothetical protein
MIIKNIMIKFIFLMNLRFTINQNFKEYNNN